MGVYLTVPLEIPAAEKQMRFEEVPGRAGALSIDQGGYLDVDATLEGFMQSGGNMGAVRAWTVSYTHLDVYKRQISGHRRHLRRAEKGRRRGI